MKQVREVVEVRVHQHPAREEVNRVVKNGRVKWRDDPGGFGTQIVRERVVCPGCASGAGEHQEALVANGGLA